MTMRNEPEQWALDLLTDIIDIGGLGGPCLETDCVECGRVALKIQAAFAEREARNLSDTQRLLWRDELGDICPSLDVCFDGSDRVRCGPCAIEAAKAKGVDPDYTLPNLPEVSRLKRENARLVGALGIVGKVLPSAAGLDDAPDSKIIACYMSMGEMRAIKEALAALKDRTNG